MNFLPPIPEWLQAFVTDSVQARQIYYGSLAAVGSLVLLVVYWRFGRGPRRRRALKLVRRHLQNQAWREAIAEIDRLQKRTRLSPAWQRRLRELHGRALLLAGQSCLEEKRFQESAEHFQEAARLLGSDASVLVGLVVDGMLAEARQLFANNKQAELFPLLERIFHLAPACPEACFWQALAFVRGGQSDQAVAILQELVARIGSENEKPIDPYLYLGTLLLRKGRIQEALRYLSEAKRLCPDSPFVCGQLGAAIVRAGGEKTGYSRLATSDRSKRLSTLAQKPSTSMARRTGSRRSRTNRRCCLLCSATGVKASFPLSGIRRRCQRHDAGSPIRSR